MSSMKPLVNYSADSDNEDISPNSSAVDTTENEWKVCYDQQSGYSYYWNVRSNQVSWDMPPDYQLVTDNASAQSLKHPMHSETSNRNIGGNQLNIATSSITPTSTIKRSQSLSESQFKPEHGGSRMEMGKEQDMLKYVKSYAQNTGGIPRKAESKSTEKDINMIISDGDSEGEEDSTIISRIRAKALLLKKLGGDIPDELNNVLDESKTDLDILAELQDDSYVVETDLDRHKDDGENRVKPLFPIADHMEKENMAKRQEETKKDAKSKRTNMKIIKLSSKAKELINASITTAKARATNFIQTKDGLKPFEEVVKESKREENKTVDQSKTSIIEKLPLDPKRVIETYESTWSQRSEDKRGFGFAVEDNEATDIKKKSNIQFVKAGTMHPTTEYTIDVERDKMVTKKMDEEEKKEIVVDPSKEKKKSCTKIVAKSDEDELFSITDEILPGGKGESREKHEEITTDLCHLITEKLKFLSQSKKQVSPVQVMAIQIETLIGAWQAGAMGLEYLSDWLEMSASQLKVLEEEAAPKGWLCEWDRSFGRYYYRNIESGSIQWDFPNEEKQDKKIKTNEAEAKLSPPSPPIISDRKRKFTKEPMEGKRNDRSRRKTPPLPSVTPPSPPPPPPLSPPAPPAPIISEPASMAPPLPLTSSQDGIKEVGVSKYTALGKVETVAKENKNWCAELDSFYSDIATIDTENEKQEQIKVEPLVAVVVAEKVEKVPAKPIVHAPTKKKKKVKLDSTLSMNKKDLSMLLSKWQNVKTDLE